MRRRLRPPPSSSVRWVTLVIEILRSCVWRRDNGAFAPQNCIGNTSLRDNENDARKPVNYSDPVAKATRIGSDLFCRRSPQERITTRYCIRDSVSYTHLTL